MPSYTNAIEKARKEITKHSTVPQSESLNATQVENSAGGFVYELDAWGKLDRFLILGSEGGTYYASESDSLEKHVAFIKSLLAQDGLRIVQRALEISIAGRAPKNDQAILVFALASAYGGIPTKQYVKAHLAEVCRTSTHLYLYVSLVLKFRGWGRHLRDSVANWYNSHSPDALGYQLVKYVQRDGWSHRDLLRLAHPYPLTSQHKALYQWVTKSTIDSIAGVPRIVEGANAIGNVSTAEQAAKLVTEYKLPWEVVPTQFRTSPVVWEALLYADMPMTAMIRNLANLTRYGVIAPLSDATKYITERLNSQDALRSARVHPIQLLSALMTYKSGHGVRGSNTWNPVPAITDALNDAFYLSFGLVEPTNQRLMLALDVSGSMGHGDIAGVPGLTPRITAAAMAMLTARTESNYMMVAYTGDGFFHNNTSITPLDISPSMRLDDVLKVVHSLNFGATDCALPMIHAIDYHLKVDAFLSYTDSESWVGKLHASEALKWYRERSGINAKFIPVGMVANDYTVGDPNDAGTMNVVGFDTATPNLISSFARGDI